MNKELHIILGTKGYGRSYYKYRKLTKDGLINEITRLCNIIVELNNKKTNLQLKELAYLDHINILQEENKQTKILKEVYKSRINKAIYKLKSRQKRLEEWNFDGYDPDLPDIINTLDGDNNE